MPNPIQTRPATIAIVWQDLPTRLALPDPPPSEIPGKVEKGAEIGSLPAAPVVDLGVPRAPNVMMSSSMMSSSNALETNSGTYTSSILHDEEPVSELPHGKFKRETRSFRGADGQTAWFKSSSTERRRTLPNSAMLIGLLDGDIFMHTIESADGKKEIQIWLRSDATWKPIDLGEQMSDVSGKTRILVMNMDGEPAWVLKGTAQKNYSNKKKASQKKPLN